MAIPGTGADAASIRALLTDLRADDPPVHGGKVMAYVYDAGSAAATTAGLEALAAFGEVNALDPTTFPSVARLENDLVGWGLDVLHAPADAAGIVTSGGTESCILAVLAARTAWRAQGREGRCSIVLADTAHPAFHKAAHLLDMEVDVLPVDRDSLSVGGAAVEAALARLGDRAALVVASAPSYAHGVVDEIEDMARACRGHEVPLHVDACIGGVVLGCAPRAGDPAFDFTIEGVTSVAMDLHKYGFAPKGVSLLLTRTVDYRTGAYFAFSSWPGYPVVNTTLQSTKSAGPMAAAWAVLHALGTSGLSDALERARRATDDIVAAVDGIPGLRVVGRPGATLIAIAGDDPGIDPFRLADRMRHRGWILQPQPSYAGLPRTVHLTVQPVTWDAVDELVSNMRAAAAEAAQLPWSDPSGAGEILAALSTGSPMPPDTADLHALVDSLDPEVRDPALAALFAALFSARR